MFIRCDSIYLSLLSFFVCGTGCLIYVKPYSYLSKKCKTLFAAQVSLGGPNLTSSNSCTQCTSQSSISKNDMFAFPLDI